MVDKSTIVTALDAFIRQRPGLDYGNYGDWTAYRSEVRSIGKDLQHARALLRYVEWHDSITAEMILSAADNGGRLSLVIKPCHSVNQQLIYQARRATCGILECPPCDSWKVTIDYTTGQYWPTEYRPAVCRLLSSVIWSYWRDHCMPDGQLVHNSETGETFERYQGLRAGDWLRKHAAREFGTSVARRWFA